MGVVIFKAVHDHAVDHPDAEALRFGIRIISWQQFEGYLISTARQLKEMGVHPGQTAVVVAEDGPAMVLCVAALWAVDVRVRWIDPLSQKAAIIKQIGSIKPALILADRPRREWLKQEGIRVIPLEEAPAFDLSDGFWDAERPRVPVDEALVDEHLRPVFHWIFPPSPRG